MGSAADAIHVHMAKRALRHVAHGSVPGVLHHGQAPAPLYGQQTGSPVIQPAGKDHANNPPSERYGRGPEKRIDRGPGEVLARSAPQKNVAVVNEKMRSGAGDINRAPFDAFAAFSALDRKLRHLAEQLRQVACRPDMQNDEDRSGKIGGKAAEDQPQGFIPACGRSNDDNVVAGVTLIHGRAFRVRPQWKHGLRLGVPAGGAATIASQRLEGPDRPPWGALCAL